MSVLTDSNQYASSSRVRGVFRYLLTKTGQRESREKLEKFLSPESLIRGSDSDTATRGMIKGTINECLKMELLIEEREGDDTIVAINPELPTEAKSKSKGDGLLPQTLSGLMMTVDRDANQNLATIIAWYLTQDAYTAPGNWAEIQAALLQQVGADLLGMNDARHSQFVDWICFLGFAWRHNLKEKDLLTPDPTVYLRGAMLSIIPQRGGQPIPLGDFILKLGARCSVFETGVYRIEVENKVRSRETEQHLSSTTAFALLRLQDEKVVELSKRSDAPVYTFPDGNQIQSYSHIKRLK
jgi:hypothetical protein